MKHPRTIVVKTLLNPDEFVAFSAQCEADDVPQSRKARDLIRGWLAERNGKAQHQHQERPGYGQNLAVLLPSRAVRPRMHMRL
jgi:hypothetical protein